MRRTNGFATLIPLALAAVVLSAPADARADRLDVTLGWTGARPVKGLKPKADKLTKTKLQDREGTYNGRKLSTNADDPEVVKIKITIDGTDDEDQDEDADTYKVKLQLSDEHEPFVIDEVDKNDDPEGAELLKNLGEVLDAVLAELNKRGE